MSAYLVEYFEGSAPQFFFCQADDESHAIEQCENAYPDCSISRVYLCMEK